MMRQSNIFYRVGKDENDVTEVLCNLMRDKYLRDILLKELKIPEEMVAKINFKDIETQGMIQDGKKPDIIIKNSTCLIYIENKIKDSELQESQYTIYPKDIEESLQEYRLMIYLIPQNYREDYHDILKKTCETCEDKQSLCKIVYWQDFIKDLAKYEIENSNPVFFHALEFFKEKLGIADNDIKFNAKDIIVMNNSEDIIAVLEFLKKIVDLIIQFDKDEIILKKLNELEKYNGNFSPGTNCNEIDIYEVGKYYKYNGNKENIFVGIDFNNLFRVAEKPKYIESVETPDYSQFLLSVMLSKDIVDEKRLSGYIARNAVIRNDNWYFIRLEDKYLFVKDDIKEEFATAVTEIINDVLL